jgi:hypothetical protein
MSAETGEKLSFYLNSVPSPDQVQVNESIHLAP